VDVITSRAVSFVRDGPGWADIVKAAARLPHSQEMHANCLAEGHARTLEFACIRDAMPKSTNYKPKSKRQAVESVRTLILREQIERRVAEMAKEIRRDFPTEHLHLVGVLKGSIFFLTDLARQIGGDVSLDLISVSSYGNRSHTSGEVKLTRDLDSSIEGKTVIVVEDILDTGMTLQYLLRIFEQRKPRRLRVAVLLDKPERRIAKVRADYVGFKIPNEFVVGYGLDYAERYRTLADVAVLTLGGKEKKA
jgi:hypoxanthine phosphoribosyltransferase